MAQFLKTLWLRNCRKAAIEKMGPGYRVRLWKWERGQCQCEEGLIYFNMPGTRG